MTHRGAVTSARISKVRSLACEGHACYLAHGVMGGGMGGGGV